MSLDKTSLLVPSFLPQFIAVKSSNKYITGISIADSQYIALASAAQEAVHKFVSYLSNLLVLQPEQTHNLMLTFDHWHLLPSLHHSNQECSVLMPLAYLIPKPLIPLIYFMICLIAVQCAWAGLLLHLATVLTA